MKGISLEDVEKLFNKTEDRSIRIVLGMVMDHCKELNPWKPINKDTPWNKEILLTGPSGYKAPHDIFIINGTRHTGEDDDDWTDCSGTYLNDSPWYWIPTHWKEI